jgi:thioredoxin-related protein
MKNKIIVFILSFSFAFAADKPALLYFHAKWCLPCLEMERTVFKNPAVIKELRENFDFIRIDTDKEDQEIFCEGKTQPVLSCMMLWDLEEIPAFAILNKEGTLSHITVGGYKTAEFLNLLKAIKTSLKKEK